jgi:hypothetical protein
MPPKRSSACCSVIASRCISKSGAKHLELAEQKSGGAEIAAPPVDRRSRSFVCGRFFAGAPKTAQLLPPAAADRVSYYDGRRQRSEEEPLPNRSRPHPETTQQTIRPESHRNPDTPRAINSKSIFVGASRVAGDGPSAIICLQPLTAPIRGPISIKRRHLASLGPRRTFATVHFRAS